MKKVIKAMVATLSLLVIFNAGAKIINLNNKNIISKNAAVVQNSISCNGFDPIDPDSEK